VRETGRRRFPGIVDPIALVAASQRVPLGPRRGLALFPVLGLDGLEAVGGTIVFSGPANSTKWQHFSTCCSRQIHGLG